MTVLTETLHISDLGAGDRLVLSDADYRVLSNRVEGARYVVTAAAYPSGSPCEFRFDANAKVIIGHPL